MYARFGAAPAWGGPALGPSPERGGPELRLGPAALERGWPELRQNVRGGGMPLICESRASPVPPKPPRPVHPLLAGQGSNVDGIVGGVDSGGGGG